MEICFTIAGIRHCFQLPVVQFPVHWGHPGGPINYPPFIQDLIILTSINEVTQHLGEGNVRETARKGIAEAFKALQSHAPEGVEIGQVARQV